MKKKTFKIFNLFLLLAFPLLLHTSILADSINNDFSISVPNNYSEISKNIFSREDKNNFNIQITENSDGKIYYNDEILDKIADKMANEMNDLLKSNKDKIKEQFKDTLTEEQIEEIINSISFKGVVSKDVTTFTKNQYPALHFILNYSMNGTDYLAEIYQTASGDKLYTLTFTQSTDGYLDSNEVKDIIDSFTIKNYADVSSDENASKNIADDIIENFSKNLILYVVSGLVIGAVISGTIILVSKKQKNK